MVAAEAEEVQTATLTQLVQVAEVVHELNAGTRHLIYLHRSHLVLVPGRVVLELQPMVIKDLTLRFRVERMLSLHMVVEAVHAEVLRLFVAEVAEVVTSRPVRAFLIQVAEVPVVVSAAA
jgi:broad-specificity NMP kinase